MPNQEMKNRVKKNIIVLIPAAGSGKRFGETKNKPFFKFLDKPLLLWSLQSFQKITDVAEILPIVKKQDIEKTHKLIRSFKITKAKNIIEGGKERQDSIYNALLTIKPHTDIVIIHDGVRPYLSPKLIKKMLNELIMSNQSIDGIITGVPVKDTIKRIEKNFIQGSEEIFVEKTLNRDLIWAVQTPQIFNFEILLSSYQKAYGENYYATDDSSLIERYGGKVKIILGSYKNIKITTPEDIKIAEALLKK
ncbi:MAG: 2-C-methyl-D-erythritol 4-phosphate cytidylyltransferase [Thermodesulfovibrionales bacterium]|nr:2-C-methyl-D-erythritol 4-phosphate cytidylyltransferase [Thermodesulfovibrionales bacterium]